MPRKVGEQDTKSGDPNVLTVEDGMRIRLLDGVIANWTQHIIENPTDDEKVKFVVCPGPAACPLCRKPTKEDGEQRFPRQRRYATNVWDYKSNSMKVLIGGPQIFKVFDDNARLGVDPLTADYVIGKSGKGRDTTYSVTKLDSSPPPAFDPASLIDVGKYETATSVERIFELLEEYGIDYDALAAPSLTLDEALAFVIPYGKMKGMTMEQITRQDVGYAKYMHGMKLEQGAVGDLVFIAFQRVLEDLGEVGPLDEALAASPAPQSTPTTVAQPALITLISPDGESMEVPASAQTALLAAGYTEPVPEPAPQPDTAAPTEITLVGPDGNEVTVPIAAKDAMLASGFQEKSAVQAAPPAEPVAKMDGANYVVTNDGTTETAVPEAALAAMIAAGYAQVFVTTESADPTPEPAKPTFTPPAPHESVQIKLNAVPAPVPIAWNDGLKIVRAEQGHFVDDEQQAWVLANLDADAEKTIAESIRQQANDEQSDPANVPEADPDKPHVCGVCGTAYKTQGGLTQHCNKNHNGNGNEAATAAAPAPGKPVVAADVDAELLDRVKDMLQKDPISKDYEQVLGFLTETAGGQSLIQMNNEQLSKIEAALVAKAA